MLCLSAMLLEGHDVAFGKGSSMNVLVLGSGGREHAIVSSLALSPDCDKIFIAPGNGGAAPGAQNVRLDILDGEAVVHFARENDVGLVVIGPEAPLVAGVGDAVRAADILCFGPGAEGARMEGSKQFSKEFMQRHDIPTAAFASFTNADDALNYLESQQAPIVVKADGLAAGKGVTVASSMKEAKLAVQECFAGRFGEAGATVVIEQCMSGPECSLLVFTDGKRVLPMACAQDHKRAYEGDTGPNTGGMGVYSPVPVVTDEEYTLMLGYMEKTIAGLVSEGIDYRGVLYGGFMLTEEGPKVLEFNARFGDPETQVILPRLKTDLLEVMLAVAAGDASKINLDWDENWAVSVVLASAGYPGDYEKGKRISGIQDAEALKGVKVYHAGTKLRDDGSIETAGGRVLNVTALAPDFTEARDLAYKACDLIDFEGKQLRRDIGARALPVLSRRSLIASALGIGAAVATVSGGALLAGCSSQDENQTEELISKAAQDKDVPVVEVSPEQVINGTEFEEAPVEDYIELVASYDLPVGSLAYQIDSISALVLLPGEERGVLRQIGILDLENGEIRIIVDKPIGTERNVVIYDARASDVRLAWVEIDLGSLKWKVYVLPMLQKRVGDPVLVEEGGEDYEPPMLAVYDEKVYWTFMPLPSGKANLEDSYLRAIAGSQDFSAGKAYPYTVLTSHGRMITNPIVTDGIITVVPRVDTTNVYYQITALNCSNDKLAGTLILPQSLRVSDAVFIDKLFTFSIDDNYKHADGLKNFGTYQQLSDGNYLRVSKPPTNAMVHFGDCLVIKSTNSIIGIDSVARKLFIIRTPPRCADYGEALIGSGKQDNIVTCSVRMKQGGRGAEAVLIRVFGMKPRDTQETGAQGAEGIESSESAEGTIESQST